MLVLVLGRAGWSNIWDVAQRDPHAAVVASLTAPSDFSPEPDPVAGPEGRVPRARVMSHGPYARDPAAIAVIKERESVDRRLYAVTFDDLPGNWWFWLVAAEHTERGWVAHGVAGGSNGPAERERATPRPSSVGSRPWLNLCGQWGGETFYAGGALTRLGRRSGTYSSRLMTAANSRTTASQMSRCSSAVTDNHPGPLTSTHPTARCSLARTRDLDWYRQYGARTVSSRCSLRVSLGSLTGRMGLRAPVAIATDSRSYADGRHAAR